MWDFMAYDGDVLVIYNLLWFQVGFLGVSVFRYNMCADGESQVLSPLI
jgi:hypothetical protein